MSFYPVRILFQLSILLMLMISMKSTQAQDCPFGVENCISPCGRYIDTDGDGWCDRTIRTITKTDSLHIKKDSTIQQTDHYQIHNNSTKKSANTNFSTDTLQNQNLKYIISHINDNTLNAAKLSLKPIHENPKNKSAPRYQLIFYSSLTIGAYLLSLLLMHLKVFKKKTHRRIWNVLLLLTFLISGLLGLILVIQINYNVLTSFFIQFLQWHVDFGIGMALISIFHIIWHFTYFKNIFKKTQHNEA